MSNKTGKERQRNSLRKVLSVLFFCFFSFVMSALGQDEMKVKLQGFGYIETGRLQHVSDTLKYNMTGNWIYRSSAQVSALVTINEHWEGALGVGAAQSHKMQGRGEDSRLLQMEIESYIGQARFTYTMDDREAPKLQLTMGYFPYNYNSDVKNLGLYLLRGPVYPGLLISGFETKATLERANLLGIQSHSNFGNYTQDVFLTSEVDIRPYLDYSLAYIGQFQFSEGAIKIGAGVNFYHLLPISPKVTTPNDTSVFLEPSINDPDHFHPYDNWYIAIDTASGDTTALTSKGTKLTSFFSISGKQLLDLDAMGDEDLKLYGEVAVIGVKDYKGVYDKISERIPVMLGFNFPVFNLLDHLSLEVEWYGAKYRNDMKWLMEEGSPSPNSHSQEGRYLNTNGDSVDIDGAIYPKEDPYYLNNMVKDNWKWSLHASKTLAGHLRISGQIANDHYRPSGVGDKTTYMTAFSTLDDWYWMLKFAYHF